MSKYPIYIVSKGRAYNPITANHFLGSNIDFRIVIEPFEYEDYKNAIPKEKILLLPFENLGLGSYPARNWIWEHSKSKGAKRHWIFDDNIRCFYRMNKGIKVKCNTIKSIKIIESFTDRYTNIGISAPNAMYLCSSQERNPISINVHAYSGLLILNSLKCRWRLKYNEDVDLCLQVLSRNYCTVLFKALLIDKTSTVVKMKGGNQSELYKNNDTEKKKEKALTLYKQWPNLVKLKYRYGRPHHYINWSGIFNNLKLRRRSDIDWSKMTNIDNFGLELKQLSEEIQSPELISLLATENKL